MLALSEDCDGEPLHWSEILIGKIVALRGVIHTSDGEQAINIIAVITNKEPGRLYFNAIVSNDSNELLLINDYYIKNQVDNGCVCEFIGDYDRIIGILDNL